MSCVWRSARDRWVVARSMRSLLSKSACWVAESIVVADVWRVLKMAAGGCVAGFDWGSGCGVGGADSRVAIRSANLVSGCDVRRRTDVWRKCVSHMRLCRTCGRVRARLARLVLRCIG